MRTTLTIAALAAALLTIAAAAPVQASALQCSGTVTVLSASEDSAEDAWRSQVASSLGNAWADLSLAKNKQYYDQNLGLGTLWTLSAQPCRHVLVVQTIGNIGNLTHSFEPVSPGPVSPGNGGAPARLGIGSTKFKFGG